MAGGTVSMSAIAPFWAGTLAGELRIQRATVSGTGRLIRFQPERAAGRHSTDRAGTEQDAAERGRGPIRREGLASEARAKRVNLATAKRAAASYDKTESVFTGGWMVT